jgi:hypothetical protein
VISVKRNVTYPGRQSSHFTAPGLDLTATSLVSPAHRLARERPAASGCPRTRVPSLPSVKRPLSPPEPAGGGRNGQMVPLPSPPARGRNGQAVPLPSPPARGHGGPRSISPLGRGGEGARLVKYRSALVGPRPSPPRSPCRAERIRREAQRWRTGPGLSESQGGTDHTPHAGLRDGALAKGRRQGSLPPGTSPRGGVSST